MENLTPNELERFATDETITLDDLTQLRHRAEADPATWMVSPGSARVGDDPMEPITLNFFHKPTQKSYGFGYAKLNDIWYKVP